MKKIAMIPLRAGSKSIKNKNRKKMLGRPLFTWVLGEAYHSNLNQVYVFTDDKEIIDYVEKEYKYTDKIKVLQRSEESSTDTASTEFAMKEFVNSIDHDYDLLFLLQATSPLSTKEAINKVIEKIEKDSYDSALTVVENKRFIWDKCGNSINYDYNNRPRRQDFEGYLVENGAIYGTTKQQFEKSGIRIGGNIGIVKMPEDTLIEIDEPNDWYIVENLLENRLRKNKKKNSKIKALFLDVDGVFTKGTVYFDNNGELLKEFSLRDGMGLEILRENDIEVFVITSENSDIVKSRMNKLKIDNYYPGVKDKYTKIEDILIDRNYKREEIAYIGDDINDLSNLISVGWSFCPKNAVKEIKDKVDIILNNDGGREAIREAVSFIIEYNKRED
ncbi:acylneuraminate cytidylyltransferase [Geotoga petraea]|uniref:N-acylneuraminate cytidylyltransferase n=1 Tax=Geotoga petraea TaxID=28234 RepID=A0A1G6PK39_9BACT|nr:acylneuraminate cytidylyltransferase [Geotoga petraea]SDC79944.1 N-acylneuraminate cytidylyltransferase [Geotoga petraea]